MVKLILTKILETTLVMLKSVEKKVHPVFSSSYASSVLFSLDVSSSHFLLLNS